MKGYRKLRVGEVIREGDVYFSSNGSLVNSYVIGEKAGRAKGVCSPITYYRPLPAKKGEKWTYTKCGDKGAYLRVRSELKGVIWSLKDAKLITAAVNKHLEAA